MELLILQHSWVQEVSEAVTSELSLGRQVCWLGSPELAKDGFVLIKAEERESAGPGWSSQD